MFQYFKDDYLLLSHIALSEKFINLLPQKIFFVNFEHKDKYKAYYVQSCGNILPPIDEIKLHAYNKILAFTFTMVRKKTRNNSPTVIVSFMEIWETEKLAMQKFANDRYITGFKEVRIEDVSISLTRFIPTYLQIETTKQTDCFLCKLPQIGLVGLLDRIFCTNVDCVKFEVIPSVGPQITKSTVPLHTLKYIEERINHSTNMSEKKRSCIKCKQCKRCVKKRTPCKQHKICNHKTPMKPKRIKFNIFNSGIV